MSAASSPLSNPTRRSQRPTKTEGGGNRGEHEEGRGKNQFEEEQVGSDNMINNIEKNKKTRNDKMESLANHL